MRRRFFVEEFEAGSATLRGEAAHHLGRVLRAETGQLYELSDGQCVWLARTESVGRDEVQFSLVEQLPAPVAPVRIELLLAIVKFDRFEWALEKATELGAEEIAPLAADRSEKGLIAAAGKRAERWKRILAESAQQARRLRIPALQDAAKPRDAFRASAAPAKIVALRASGREAAARSARARCGAAIATTMPLAWPSRSVPKADGPTRNLRPPRLADLWRLRSGANILRTETAVCAALAAVQYAFGAFRPGDAQ